MKSLVSGLIERTITVDLSDLIPKIGELFENEKVELKLIEFYRFLQDENNSPFTLFNKYMLSHYYKEDQIKSPTDIYFFIKDKIYINKVKYFLDQIYITILDYVNPEFVDVVFDSFKEKTENKLIVDFKVYYPKRIETWI